MEISPNWINIKNQIEKYGPNQNLVEKIKQLYEVNEQLQKEKRFYNNLKNPFKGNKQIANIYELNELINDLDNSYNFKALLPNDEVDRKLSNKYNLTLQNKLEFTDEEEKIVKEKFEELTESVMPVLLNDPKFTQQSQDKIVDYILIAISALELKKDRPSDDTVTIFTSAAAYKAGFRSFELFDLKPPAIKKETKLGTIQLQRDLKSKNIKSKDSDKKTTIAAKVSTELQYRNNIPVSLKITGPLNEMGVAREDLYRYAESQGWFDSLNRELNNLNNSLGSGSISPMSVSAQEWKTDVFNAINSSLSGQYANLLDPSFNSPINQLFQKWIGDKEIALGRSKSNLHGFLGELRSLLIMSAIIGKDFNPLGTAKIRMANSETGAISEDAPVDLIAKIMGEEFGFQVKNVESGSSYSWEGEMQINNFYIERLQEKMSEEERQFFGMLTYHYPLSDSTQDYKNYYNENFMNNFDSKFIPIYRKLALYIIRQQTAIIGFNSPSYQLLNQDKMQNDFFIMKDKIISASSIYGAMNANAQDYIDATFGDNKVHISNGYYSPKDKEVNYAQYSNLPKIKYRVLLRYASLLNSAYSKI